MELTEFLQIYGMGRIFWKAKSGKLALINKTHSVSFAFYISGGRSFDCGSGKFWEKRESVVRLRSG